MEPELIAPGSTEATGKSHLRLGSSVMGLAFRPVKFIATDLSDSQFKANIPTVYLVHR